MTHVNYYCVLGLFKLACVMEGSFARFRAGTSDDTYFASLEQGVPALARRALEFAPFAQCDIDDGGSLGEIYD